MTNEITQFESVKSVFEKDETRRKFEEMLGKKASGFIVSVINAVQNSDMLQKADRNSILFSAATAASLDLPINENLGFAYIVPYNRKQKDGTYQVLAQFQLGYKGFIQLAQRSGQFKTINATDVREGEIESLDRLTGEIVFNWIEDKDVRDKTKVIGYVGYFKMINGFEKTLFMTNADLKNHGKEYSQSFKKGYGLWEDKFDAMAIKTVLKLLLSKYAPLSIEMQKAVLADQAIVDDWDGNSLHYPDNENVIPEVGDVADAKEKDRILDFISKAKTMEELDDLDEKIDFEENEEITNAFNAKVEELSKKAKK
jgi:recombination protein RecT